MKVLWLWAQGGNLKASESGQQKHMLWPDTEETPYVALWVSSPEEIPACAHVNETGCGQALKTTSLGVPSGEQL